MYHIVVCIRLIFRVLPDWLTVGGDRERGAGERTAAGGGVGDRGEEGGQEHEEKEEVGTSREDRQTREGIDGKSRSRGRKVLTFLHALTIFFKSYSEESPCTVVKVLRPFRCWILICTRPSWTSSSEPLIASAKGSAGKKNEMPSSSSDCAQLRKGHASARRLRPPF